MKHLLSFFAAFLLVAPPLCSAQSEEHAGTIVFASYRSGMNQLYSMDARGGNLQQLTDSPSGAFGAVVSPRGGRVAFKNNVNSAAPSIAIMSIDGSEVVDLVKLESQTQHIAWSPDGSKLTFSSQVNGYYQIFSINADGTNLQQLTHGARSAISASWGPAGDRILYVSANASLDDPVLFWMNANGTDPQPVPLPTERTVPSPFTAPAWSPDGHHVLIESSGDIWLLDMNPGGISAAEKLTHTSNVYEYEPAWSPEGGAFAYTAASDAGEIISVMNVGGGGLNDLSTAAGALDAHDPSWGRSLIQTPTLIEAATWGQLKAMGR